MRWALIFAIALTCCSDEETSEPPVEDTSDGVVSSDGIDGGDGGVTEVTPHDPPDVVIDVPDTSGAPSFELELVVAPCVPEVPCPYRVRHPEGVSGSLQMIVDGAGLPPTALRRGKGSGELPGMKPGDHEITFVLDGAVATFELELEEKDWIEHAGLVAGQLWAADVVHHVTDSLSIDGDLKISPGVQVVVAPGANIEISGAMTVLGTPELPVLITAATGAAWGGLRLVGLGSSDLAHVFLSGGGGDDTLHFGHSDSQPLVRLKAGELTMTGGGVTDSRGKGFGCTQARITLSDVLVARVDTGGEFDRCALTMSEGHISEIPDGDGVSEDDDNDGLYLLGVFTDNDAPVESLISDSVFFLGEDDGIDHNDALVRVERAWIEDFANEGVAASVGQRIAVVDSVIRGCDQGIEAGYGTPNVEIDHCLITQNGTGIRFGDSYDWGADGTFIVTHTVAVENDINVRNHLNSTGEPHPDGLQIACSMVDDPNWDEVANNVSGVPTITGGCVDAASMASPCDEDVPGPRACP